MKSWQDYIGQIVLGDCMDVLRQIPDGAVDVLLTDPPYGNCEVRSTNYEVKERKRRGRFGNKGSRFEKYRKMAGAGHWKYGDEMTAWDVAPGPEVFQELFRVSKEQIIWGGNYFELPATRCFNVWRKLTISEGFSMAMCEYAWTSYKTNAKWWEFAPQDAERFHPTQKPLGLICRQLEEYTKPGDLVLDCYSGSGTVAVACYMTGRQFIAVEKKQSLLGKERGKACGGAGAADVAVNDGTEVPCSDLIKRKSPEMGLFRLDHTATCDFCG